MSRWIQKDIFFLSTLHTADTLKYDLHTSLMNALDLFQNPVRSLARLTTMLPHQPRHPIIIAYSLILAASSLLSLLRSKPHWVQKDLLQIKCTYRIGASTACCNSSIQVIEQPAIILLSCRQCSAILDSLKALNICFFSKLRLISNLHSNVTLLLWIFCFLWKLYNACKAEDQEKALNAISKINVSY